MARKNGFKRQGTDTGTLTLPLAAETESHLDIRHPALDAFALRAHTARIEGPPQTGLRSAGRSERRAIRPPQPA